MSLKETLRPGMICEAAQAAGNKKKRQPKSRLLKKILHLRKDQAGWMFTTPPARSDIALAAGSAPRHYVRELRHRACAPGTIFRPVTSTIGNPEPATSQSDEPVGVSRRPSRSRRRGRHWSRGRCRLPGSPGRQSRRSRQGSSRSRPSTAITVRIVSHLEDVPGSRWSQRTVARVRNPGVVRVCRIE